MTCLRIFLAFLFAVTAGDFALAETQPEMTALKATFVPGDKTLFYDDFTDMTADSPPPHFKVRGSGVELLAAGEARQLNISQRGSIFPNLTLLPKNFTLETELKVETTNRAILTMNFLNGARQTLQISTTASKDSSQVISLRSPKYEELGRKNFKADWSRTVKVAVWIQEGRLRTYVDGEKLLDVNQVNVPEITGVEFAHDFYGAKQSIGYRNVRFAETAPDFSKIIASTGRYVTYGIRFDTGSDRLKPESAPVVQFIAKGLEADPTLKLLIEGHTDSVGDAKTNLDLSRRRAEALKEVLTTQFKIDPARLSTAGLGDTKPAAPNDTPQGRSQNRRVELVKQ